MRALACVLVLAMSACVGAKPDVVLDGSNARVLAPYGFDYSGQGVRHAEGALHAVLDSRAERADVVATAEDASHRYEIRWASVAATDDYQAGGVARGLRLHGATGNGSADLPAFDAYAAAWGTATIRVDGGIEKDPTTGRDAFSAAFYVVRGRVRDLATGMIFDAFKRGPYDPATPENAYVNPDGAQAMVLLRAADGTPWRGLEFEQILLTKY